MQLNKWVKKWRIAPEAVKDLCEMMGIHSTPIEAAGVSEAANQQKIRLNHSHTGGRLWRNNSGVLEDINGRPVRYGLANDSAKANQELKSSDLIGITPRLISYEDIGCVIGQFTAIEVKRDGWKFHGDDREVAQMKYLLLVMSMGGIGKFSTGEGV